MQEPLEACKLGFLGRDVAAVVQILSVAASTAECVVCAKQLPTNDRQHVLPP